MLKKLKFEDCHIGMRVVFYPGDTILQEIDYIDDFFIRTHYLSSPYFHLVFPKSKFGKAFYELFYDSPLDLLSEKDFNYEL